MRFNFVNKCSVNIFVSVNGTEKFALKPHENKEITLDDFCGLALTVRKENKSFLEKSFLRKKYKLTIETAYELSSTKNESLTLVFLRECVRVGSNVYYEKIILKNKPVHCIEKRNVIFGLNFIKKTYNKRRWTYLLLVSPFEHMTLLCLVAIVLAIVFACKINILFSLLFFCLHMP